MKTLLAAIIIAAAALTSRASVVYYNYSVMFTMLVQDPNSTTTATKFKLSNKELLTYLSQAEFYAGNYTQAAFPSGSTLAYEYNQETSEGRFVVRDSTKAIICDVSDVLTLEFSPAVDTGTGGSNYQENMIYDSTPLGLDLQFQTSYLTNEKASKGIQTCKGTTGVGSGVLGVRNLLITGSASSSTK